MASREESLLWFYGDFSIPSIALPPLPPGKYPGDYFEKRKGKPEVTIVRYPYAPDDIAVHVLECVEGTQRASADIVNFLIYTQLAQMEATLDSDWTSFNVQIGKAGDIITPLSLLDVTLDESSKKSAEKLKTSSRKYSAALAMYYIFAPVLLDTPHVGLKTGLMKNMEEAVPEGELYKPEHHKCIAGWYSYLKYHNCTYKRLVAALDMFFVRFPDHPSNKLRVGTNRARYKGCAVETLHHFSSLMEIPVQQVPAWVWHEQARAEALQLLSPKNELDVRNSYAPYYLFLHTGEKGISSVAYNPNFHLFVHTVGTVLGSARSKNARMPEFADRTAISAGFIVGAIEAVNRKQQALAKSKSAAEEDDIVMAFIEQEAENFPTNMNSGEWEIFLRDKDISTKFALLGARLAQRITDVRRGSVGAAC